MSDRRERARDHIPRLRASVSALPRAIAWLIVFLRYPLVLAWIGGAVYLTVTLPGIDDSGSQLGGIVPEESEALKAESASLSEFKYPMASRTMVVERDPAGLSARAEARIVHRTLRLNQGDARGDPAIAGALPISSNVSLDPSAAEPGTAVLSYLFPSPKIGADGASQIAHQVAERRSATGPAPEAYATGTVPAQIEQGTVITDHLIWLDIATVLLVLVVVGFHFRAAGPPLLTLAAVAIALFVSTRLVTWALSKAGLPLPTAVTPVMTVLLFGVLTDYSIFLIARFRALLLEEGTEPKVAARRCIGEMLPVIATAGLVIALATGSLYFADLGFLHALGPGLGLTVLVATLVGLTFVPAALAITGRAMLWPRKVAEGERVHRTLGIGGRAIRTAVRHPVIVATLSCALLIAAASGLMDMHASNPQMTNLPASSEVNRGYHAAADAFGPGIVAPTTVVVEGEGIAEQRQELASLQTGLTNEPGVARVIGPSDDPVRRSLGVTLAPSGNAARFLVLFDSDPLGADAISNVESMRSDMPELVTSSGLDGAQTLIGGDTALSADTSDATQSDLIRVAPIALAVIFCMLALLLRALVAPLYLIAASILSLLAALGLTAYLFEDILGYDGIALFVPLTIAVLLLSLGSDYNIFLVGRIWQEAKARPLREAIEVAGGRSTRAITVAGVVLAGSFAAAALIPLQSFRELAFGMSAGLLIDAVIVRALLVPSLIAIFGARRQWSPAHSPRLAAEGSADAPGG